MHLFFTFVSDIQHPNHTIPRSMLSDVVSAYSSAAPRSGCDFSTATDEQVARSDPCSRRTRNRRSHKLDDSQSTDLCRQVVPRNTRISSLVAIWWLCVLSRRTFRHDLDLSVKHRSAFDVSASHRTVQHEPLAVSRCMGR